MTYQIIIAGTLDRSWSDWLGNVSILAEQSSNGSFITTITIHTDDQARLFGIIDQIRDLNIKLLAVTGIENKSNDSDLGGQP